MTTALDEPAGDDRCAMPGCRVRTDGGLYCAAHRPGVAPERVEKFAPAHIEALLRATDVLHDALCSKTPSREYAWSEVAGCIKTVRDFDSTYPNATAELAEALCNRYSPGRFETFIKMVGEVEVALDGLVTHPPEDIH